MTKLLKEVRITMNQDEKHNAKTRALEEKFNIDLTGKTWFECTIEEVKYSTFSNQPQRNVDTAYVVINRDSVEILKESMFIKSNMGTRKIFYDNITSIDYDARGVFHLSNGVVINTKSSEHIQLKYVNEEDFIMLNNAFEQYMTRPQENSVISQSSKADDLVKYAELFEKGLISEEEFTKLKNEIINGEPVSDLNEDNLVDYRQVKNKFCIYCGSEVDSDAKFCQSCGNKLI